MVLLLQLHSYILTGYRVIICLVLAYFTMVFLGLLSPVRLFSVSKLLITLIYLGMLAIFFYGVLVLAPITIAKLLLVAALIIGGCFCLILLPQVSHWNHKLDLVQQECEIAAKVTYLQGEVLRAQLEALNEKLKHTVEPEKKEMAAAVLKTISPLAMLYLNKERSILKWSFAAARLGNNL